MAEQILEPVTTRAPGFVPESREPLEVSTLWAHGLRVEESLREEEVVEEEEVVVVVSVRVCEPVQSATVKAGDGQCRWSLIEACAGERHSVLLNRLRSCFSLGA
ncbi:MAG: hypothetical protein JW808_02050 [Victivallales bacterium]|nr:hypothetical protein [Victivallales bacterium]